MLALNIFLLFLQIFVGFSIDLESHFNDMANDEMERYAISNALSITGTEKNLKIAAKMISTEMNKKFGPSWSCFTGINANFSGFNFDYKEHHLLWFSYKETHFLIFKLPVYAETDPIIDARQKGAKEVLLYNELTDEMKNSIIIMTKEYVNSYNTTEAIATQIVDSLERKYKNKWVCIIGSVEYDYKIMESAVSGTNFQFNIGTLKFIVFQAKEKIEDGPEVIIPLFLFL